MNPVPCARHDLPEVIHATRSDVTAIVELIETRVPLCLPVSEDEVLRHLDAYGVLKINGEVIATASVHQLGPRRSELRSVAVAAGWEGRGLGAHVVRWAMCQAQEAHKLLCCVTYNTGFFERLGFAEVPPMFVPPKPRRAEFPVKGKRTTMAWNSKARYLTERRYHHELRATA